MVDVVVGFRHVFLRNVYIDVLWTQESFAVQVVLNGLGAFELPGGSGGVMIGLAPFTLNAM